MSIPGSTYRIQLSRDARLDDARRLVSYLDALGIGHLYASPILAARPGSAHGYDVVDPTRLDPDRGSNTDLAMLHAALEERGMGLLLDIVPNHMAAAPENRWWHSVLAHGPASPYADFFDIDWAPAGDTLHGQVLLPVLGDHYGRVLERGEFRAVVGPDGLSVRYHDHALPLDPATYPAVLAPAARRVAEARGHDTPAARALALLVRELDALPPRTARDRERRRARVRGTGRARARLWRLYNADPAVRDAVDAVLREFNGEADGKDPYAALDDLLRRQAYFPAYWRLASEEANYRRFFDISDLVALRVKDPRVFDAVHAKVLELVRLGVVTGLRIDHVDGLEDPLEYLRRLDRRLADEAGAPVYRVVEKILSEGEPLPRDWPVHGTTGYDFLNAANTLFLHPAGVESLERQYAEFTGDRSSFADVRYRSKREIIATHFQGELASLTRLLTTLARTDRHARDVAKGALRAAVTEITACLPVYRTYVHDAGPTARDGQAVRRALAEARRRNPTVDPAAYAFVQRLLLEPDTIPEPADAPDAARHFITRWQQFSAPVMAKGTEDTALYRYTPLISLNEVGGAPIVPDDPVDAFHRHNRARAGHWPAGMNTLSTHDTKRGGDVRAGINVLSELAGAWGTHVRRWQRWNGPKKGYVAGIPAPGPAMELLIYQTLAGAWPLDEGAVPPFRRRLRTYLVKAAREAKVRTSWTHPAPPYETALQEFADTILRPGDDNRFLDDFLRLQRRISYYGALNSLAQTLLLLASPGIPDIYQGTELWRFDLVDPDNRRPVDYERRIALLDEILAASPAPDHMADYLRHWRDGRIKLHLISTALRSRRTHEGLYRAGGYQPLRPVGERSRHVCAFARRQDNEWLVVAVPRLISRLTAPEHPPVGEAVWGDTALPLPAGAPAHWHNVLTGEELRSRTGAAGPAAIPLADAMAHSPLLLLHAPSA